MGRRAASAVSLRIVVEEISGIRDMRHDGIADFGGFDECGGWELSPRAPPRSRPPDPTFQPPATTALTPAWSKIQRIARVESGRPRSAATLHLLHAGIDMRPDISPEWQDGVPLIAGNQTRIAPELTRQDAVAERAVRHHADIVVAYSRRPRHPDRARSSATIFGTPSCHSGTISGRMWKQMAGCRRPGCSASRSAGSSTGPASNDGGWNFEIRWLQAAALRRQFNRPFSVPPNQRCHHGAPEISSTISLSDTTAAFTPICTYREKSQQQMTCKLGVGNPYNKRVAQPHQAPAHRGPCHSLLSRAPVFNISGITKLIALT